MSRGELIMEVVEHGPQMLQEGVHAVHHLQPHQDTNGQWMIGDLNAPDLQVKKAEVATAALLDDVQKQASKASRAAFEERRAKQVEAENAVNVAGKQVDAETAWSMGEMGLQFMGVPGMVISSGAAAMAGKASGEKQIDHMVDFYRDTVASALRIQPEMVDEKALKQFANVRAMAGDKTVQEAIEKSEGKALKGAMRSGTGVGGFFAGAAAGSAILPGIGSLVGGGIGAIAGEQAMSALMGGEQVTANDQIEALTEKYNAGEQVNAGDVFAVRMHQLKRLEVLVEEKCDHLGLKSFEKLDDMDRAKVMREFPDALADVSRDAAILNSGAASPDQLAQTFNLQEVAKASNMISQPSANMNAAPSANTNAAPTQGAWAQRVGGQKVATGSYAEQVRAQQAAAAMQTQSL